MSSGGDRASGMRSCTSVLVVCLALPVATSLSSRHFIPTRVHSCAFSTANSAITSASATASRCGQLQLVQPEIDEQRAKLAKLAISLAIDLVGYSTYLVPLAGEAGDLAWAPISALLIAYLYGNNLLVGIAFAEELSPGLDFIPTATIGWILENTDFGRNFNQVANDPPERESQSTAAEKAKKVDVDEDVVVVDVKSRR